MAFLGSWGIPVGGTLSLLMPAAPSCRCSHDRQHRRDDQFAQELRIRGGCRWRTGGNDRSAKTGACCASRSCPFNAAGAVARCSIEAGAALDDGGGP
jgi:hypothetical protein